MALLGPRRVGKTTLALEISLTLPSLYLDLETCEARAKLSDPELFFSRNTGVLITCIIRI